MSLYNLFRAYGGYSADDEEEDDALEDDKDDMNDLIAMENKPNHIVRNDDADDRTSLNAVDRRIYGDVESLVNDV